MSTSQGPDDIRKGKLTKFYRDVLSGKRDLRISRDGENFIEAISVQRDKPTCINELITSSHGLSAVQSSMRFSTGIKFLNGHATILLQYLQDPDVKRIAGGDFLQKVLLHVVDPPIFWNALALAYREDTLEKEAQKGFAWLLSELVSLPHQTATPYYSLANDTNIQSRLLNSSEIEIRNFGQKIKHILSGLSSAEKFDTECGPGGRHDNDCVDFREIAILPTADELTATEPPFLRLADAIDDPETQESRVAIHLDNQFRLLREDMLGEMREELQIALGVKKGRHRGLVLDGGRVEGIECGDIHGANGRPKFQPWCLKLRLLVDLPKLAKLAPKKRKEYFEQNKNVLKHQSQVCLIIDGEVVAFPSVNRDIVRLAEDPPLLLLQFSGLSEASVSRTFVKLKNAKEIKMVQIDTAVFSFEPVLKRLQETKNLNLKEELLHWDLDQTLQEPPSPPSGIVQSIEDNPSQDLRNLIGTPKSIKLDASQSSSLLSCLNQRVSLIQGPPGTGKSFIGALAAKILYDYTKKTILVVCYTNHALDQFLMDLMNIGIPSDAMVRLGGKSDVKTKSLALFDQTSTSKTDSATWKLIDQHKKNATQLAERLQTQFNIFSNLTIKGEQILDYLELSEEDPAFFEAFQVPENEDGTTVVGGRGRKVKKSYLVDQWMNGRDAGVYKWRVTDNDAVRIWSMLRPARQAALDRWKLEILQEHSLEIAKISNEYHQCQQLLDRLWNRNRTDVLKSKRIIGATTTGAAKYSHEILSASADILLVEEAGEILESHVLTAMGADNTKQLILIGDHKQLRPKVNNYQLSVEKGEGYDLNRSLFERLILKGYPHQTLTEQHRMRPEISALVRELTYPDLRDAPGTKNRPDLRGFRDNLVFVKHNSPEDENSQLSKQVNGDTSSKRNRFEVDMILKCIKYLGQQGYGTDKIIILTPYLGQLQLLREVLGKTWDPVLNDLDSYDLIRAGLLPAASNGQDAKRSIRMSTIDNYQGEESDIVLITLTRSNASGDIGFMKAPERVNVLLSRARDALLMIGNSDTFLKSRHGGELWGRFFDMIKQQGHIYEGFPVKCERHPDRIATLCKPVEFEEESPDGGCKEPCGTMLNCGIHQCPSRCHQLHDHSKVKCEARLKQDCPVGHPQAWKCHESSPVTCRKCDVEKDKAEKKKQREFDLQQKKDAEQKEHLRELAALDDKIEQERQRVKELQEKRDRDRVIQQKQKDLADAKEQAERAFSSPSPPSSPRSITTRQAPNFVEKMLNSLIPTVKSSSEPSSPKSLEEDNIIDILPLNTPPTDSENSSPALVTRNSAVNYTPKPFPKTDSQSEKEWQRQKIFENVHNPAIDKLMDMIGLETVKQQVLSIKAKVDITLRQGTDLKNERFGVSLLGNPGTGKTTVARLYAEFLNTIGILPGTKFVEATGSGLANEGVAGAKKRLDELLNAGGGAFFVDEAYQLADSGNIGGKQVLEYLLAEIENTTGKIVFLFAGYNKQMEKFFEHNPGIQSRIPYTLQFADYEDGELLEILEQVIVKKYERKMKVEGGIDGLYVRIAVRRVGKGRGKEGYGNARAIHNAFSKITERQATRIALERKNGLLPDDYYFTQEDLIGPNPSNTLSKSKAYAKLKAFIGLDAVKDTVTGIVDLIQINYRRELVEKEPRELGLNRIFFGGPGTGKTSVGKLYGQILADVGILSSAEVVVKNPSDFVGSVIGESEKTTKAILANTVGKVLIIDEAYALYSSGSNGIGNHSDPYRTAVIDTIVAEVQADDRDRCVLLLGYEDKIVEMFQNVNPGLSRRFRIEDAFRFLDFTGNELLQILDKKMKEQEVDATDDAKKTAAEVLGRLRMRPNFGNAGEVDNLLSKATENFQKRQAKKPVKDREFDIVFEPEDFDVEFDRGKTATINCRKLFADVVGCENVVSKLEEYQQIAANMKDEGIDARESGMIPMNFIFKGPPGTGKTTTARKIGQVFYDMGFLSSTDVIVSSAPEFIGQYRGQTAPKTQLKFDEALGKVLFIDEAYSLAQDDHFGTESINAIVDFITRSKYENKMVIILAGYEDKMNQFLAVNPGLSSRFPEEIFFSHMPPKNCLEVLQKDLDKKGIKCPALKDPKSDAYKELTALIESLAALPDWGNARDMKTLAQRMIRAVYTSKGKSRKLSSSDAVGHLKSMIREKQARTANLPPSSYPLRMAPKESNKLSEAPPPSPPPPPSLATTTTAQTAKPSPPAQKEDNPPPTNGSTLHDPQRDAGVSDDIWNQLQHDILAEENRVEQARRAIQEMEKLEKKEREAARRKKEAKAALARKIAQAKEEAERNELKRRHEEARLAQQKAEIARRKALEEVKRRQRAEEERKKEETRAKEKLRQMGVCPAGFQWHKQGGGWRCGGGSHFVTNGELGM